MGKSKTKVRFVEEVPTQARRSYPWREIAEQLRARPEDWALVLEDLPSSVVWAVNQGRVLPVHPDRGFRTKARKTKRKSDERPAWTGELYMAYDPSLDVVAKRNGGRA